MEKPESLEPRIDIENPAILEAYLKRTKRVNPDEVLAIRTLAGGVSNRTVWVDMGSGESWVIKQALEKLRVPTDWFSDPARIHLEAEGLRWLSQLAPEGSLPEFVFEDHSQHIFAMSAIPQPHENWKTMLLRGIVDLNHFSQFGILLGMIHRKASLRCQDLSIHFHNRSFFDSLRLEPFYIYTAQQIPEMKSFISDLVAQTWATQVTLVHGDYSPKNILVYQDRLILLDHEVVHYGDPAFDLGFSLAHLLSKAHHLRHLSENLIEAVLLYWRSYLASLGELTWRDTLEERAIRHTLACLLARVAGRSQVEYLTETKKKKQRTICLNLMANLPTVFEDFVHQFHQEIS
ncbi:MAG: aminoglycoside phosphotransferase family protein [SAR324 cluster bacterium]|nr:aminoglycoside phosphotransferase family protein [SAR324 cluster bacterium]